LEAAIRKYQNIAIEATQVIMELIELAKQISEAEKTRGQVLVPFSYWRNDLFEVSTKIPGSINIACNISSVYRSVCS
jgi:hypothetical protein